MAQLEFAASEEGVLNFFDDVPEAVDRYESLIREVQLEEEVGFKYHFIIEHQNVFFGQIQSPMVYLAALAQHTSTIRFSQMVFATPFYHPLRFAMDTAMIDQLSRGRLEVGVGSGASQFETDRWNIPYSERRSKFPEFMEIVKKAWTEECVTYHGQYWNFDNAIALPRPYQKPHPPIWFAARSRPSLEWEAKNNANFGAFLRPDEEIAETLGLFRQICKEVGTQRKPCPSPTFSEMSMSPRPTKRPMRKSLPIYPKPIPGVTLSMTRYPSWATLKPNKPKNGYRDRICSGA